MTRIFDHEVDDDPVFEPAYEPYFEQDLQPWERRWYEAYRFEPEEMERA